LNSGIPDRLPGRIQSGPLQEKDNMDQTDERATVIKEELQKEFCKNVRSIKNTPFYQEKNLPEIMKIDSQRNLDIEKAVWEEKIQPISDRCYHGEFQYKFFPEIKELTNENINRVHQKIRNFFDSSTDLSTQMDNITPMSDSGRTQKAYIQAFDDLVLKKMRAGLQINIKNKKGQETDIKTAFFDFMQDIFDTATLPAFLTYLGYGCGVDVPQIRKPIESVRANLPQPIESNIIDITPDGISQIAFSRNTSNCRVASSDLHKPQESQEMFEKFVSELSIEQYTDEQISFKEPHKDTMPVHAKLLMFKKPGGLTWKDLLSILNNKDLTIYTEGVGSKAAVKRVQAIDKKLIKFISTTFNITPPKGFRLYERDKTKGVGVYRFKFKLKQNTPSTKAYCRENFFKLAKQYQDNQTHDLRTHIEIRGKEYLSKGYIKKAEIQEALLPK